MKTLYITIFWGEGYNRLQGDFRSVHTRLMKRLFGTFLAFALACNAWAVEPTTYNAHFISTNDPVGSIAAETLFLSDLSAAGLSVLTEDFEDIMWETTRSPSSAEHVISQGINWHSSEGNHIKTYGDSDSYEEPPPFMIWGHDPVNGLHPVPNTVIGESNTKLYAIGFWADGTGTKGKIKVILDDTVEATFKRVTGFTQEPPDPPEPVTETVRLTYSKEFFGVYAPDGFNKFQLLEYAGEFDEVVLMWMRTFTFAYRPVTRTSDIQISAIQPVSGHVQIDFTSTPAYSNFSLQAATNLRDDFGWVTLTNTPMAVSQNVYRISVDQVTEMQRMFRIIGTN